MLDLIRDRAAREIVDERRRAADRRRLGRDARQARKAAHGTELERVRASLMLVPRSAHDSSDS
jgi:hypothetical protein